MIFLRIVGLLTVVLIIGVAAAALFASRDDRSAWQKIEDACEREFRGRGELIINDCKIRLGLKKASDRERDALSRAERLAR